MEFLFHHDELVTFLVFHSEATSSIAHKQVNKTKFKTIIYSKTFIYKKCQLRPETPMEEPGERLKGMATALEDQQYN